MGNIKLKRLEVTSPVRNGYLVDLKGQTARQVVCRPVETDGRRTEAWVPTPVLTHNSTDLVVPRALRLSLRWRSFRSCPNLLTQWIRLGRQRKVAASSATLGD